MFNPPIRKKRQAIKPGTLIKLKRWNQGNLLYASPEKFFIFMYIETKEKQTKQDGIYYDHFFLKKEGSIGSVQNRSEHFYIEDFPFFELAEKEDDIKEFK